MEIQVVLCFIYTSQLILSSVHAKTFSLNDVIAAERLTKELSPTTSSLIQERLPAKSIELIQHKIHTQTDNKFPSWKPSPLKYRKTFQIKSPAKPQKLKHLQKPLNKRKNLTTKREIHRNENINKKYIPLLRNIGMLFDNILGSDSGEDDFGNNKHKRTPIHSDSEEVLCTCTRRPDSMVNTKQTTTSTTLTTEIQTEALTSIVVATTPPYNTTDDHIGRFGWNKNISILPSRNPVGIRRNHYRFRERSSPALNRSNTRHLTGNHGDNEHHTNGRENDSSAEYYEENTNGNTRDNASRDRAGEVRRGNILGSTEVDRRTDQVEELIPSNETFQNDTGNVSEYEGKDQLQIRGDETESTAPLPEHTSGLRRHSDEESTLRSPKANEEIEFDYACDKRFTVGDGGMASENKEIGGTDEAVNTINKLSKKRTPGKVVMIFDGYSVARDVNGENKLTEKAIHIHQK